MARRSRDALKISWRQICAISAALFVVAAGLAVYWRYVYMPSEFATDLRSVDICSVHDDLASEPAGFKKRLVRFRPLLIKTLIDGEDERAVIAYVCLRHVFRKNPGAFKRFLQDHHEPEGTDVGDLRIAGLIEEISPRTFEKLVTPVQMSAYLKWQVNQQDPAWAPDAARRHVALERLIHYEGAGAIPFLLSVMRRPRQKTLHRMAAEAVFSMSRAPDFPDPCLHVLFRSGIVAPLRFRMRSLHREKDGPRRMEGVVLWIRDNAYWNVLEHLVVAMLDDVMERFEELVLKVLKMPGLPPANLKNILNGIQYHVFPGDIDFLGKVLESLDDAHALYFVSLYGSRVAAHGRNGLFLRRAMRSPRLKVAGAAYADWRVTPAAGNSTTYGSTPCPGEITAYAVIRSGPGEYAGSSWEARETRVSDVSKAYRFLEERGLVKRFRPWVADVQGRFLNDRGRTAPLHLDEHETRRRELRLLGKMLARHRDIEPFRGEFLERLARAAVDPAGRVYERFEAAFWLAKAGRDSLVVRENLARFAPWHPLEMKPAAIAAMSHVDAAQAHALLNTIVTDPDPAVLHGLFFQTGHMEVNFLVDEAAPALLDLLRTDRLPEALRAHGWISLAGLVCTPDDPAAVLIPLLETGDFPSALAEHWREGLGLGESATPEEIASNGADPTRSNRQTLAALFLLCRMTGRDLGWDRTLTSPEYRKAMARDWVDALR